MAWFLLGMLIGSVLTHAFLTWWDNEEDTVEVQNEPKPEQKGLT